MGRSVSWPSGAVVAFSHWSPDEDSEFDWEVREPFEDAVAGMFPSASKVNKWFGREDHAVMANRHAYFGISEYCGLLAYWILPRDDNDHPGLSLQWSESVADGFRDVFGSLAMVGRFSNGEAIFERKAA